MGAPLSSDCERPMRPLGLCTILLLACYGITACDGEGRVRGPSTRVTAVHAAPSYGVISFLREERFPAALEYRAASTPFEYEIGQYDFNLEITRLGESAPTRLRSFSETLQENTDYFFVITEDGAGALQELIVTKPPQSATATAAEFALIHAAPAFQAVDVYVTAPGADLSAANPVGSAGFRQSIAAQTLAVGDYQLSFTAPGNPQTPLFRSVALTAGAAQSHVFVVTDGAGEGNVPVVVVRVADLLQLTDVDAQASIRFINAASDAQPRDFVVNDDFASPLFAAAPYGVPTDRVLLAPGAPKLTVTPAGNAGVIEAESTPSIAGGHFHTTIVAGAAGDLEMATTMEDYRGIAGQARVRLFNGAGQFEFLDFFVLPAGSDIAAFFPLTLGAAGVSSLQSLPPGTPELTIRITGTTTVAYGPAPLVLADGGVYGLVTLNGATPETAEVVFIDDSQ